MSYFDNTGRCIPAKGMRVFSERPNHYYKIEQPKIDYTTILDQSKKYNGLRQDFTLNEFKEKALGLLEDIKADQNYKNLINGAHIPFVFENVKTESDIGRGLETILLPNLKSAFNNKFPESHFKAILQSDSKLPDQLTLDPYSNYQALIEASKSEPVVGWYFPQAFQEYDVKSQRLQLTFLMPPKNANICLSGGMDVISAMIGCPELLISDNHYSPILCLSAYAHKDPRLVLLLKSYGPHLEFWCMTQMLTHNTTQVSEQWAGGISIFET